MTKTKSTKTTIIFFAIICILFCCMLAGCAQTIQMTIVHADGSRSYSYTITLEDSSLNKHGITLDEAMTLINSSVLEYWSIYSYGRNTAGVDFKAGVSENDAHIYQITLTYSSFEAYCNFFGTTSEEVSQNSKADIREGAFSSEYVIADSELSSTNDLLIEMQLIPTLINRVTQSFADAFFDSDIEATTALFSQINTSIIRAYPTSLGVKANADDATQFLSNYGVEDSNLTTYTAYLWNCTLAEPTTHIYIYQTVYTLNNRIAWYGLGIGVAVLFGLVLFAVLYVRHRRERENLNTDPESNNTEIIETTATKLPDEKDGNSKNNENEITFENENKND